MDIKKLLNVPLYPGAAVRRHPGRAAAGRAAGLPETAAAREERLQVHALAHAGAVRASGAPKLYESSFTGLKGVRNISATF